MITSTVCEINLMKLMVRIIVLFLIVKFAVASVFNLFIVKDNFPRTYTIND